MKALELKTYPPIPECPPPSDLGYAYEDWMDNRSIERKLRAKKRLTDAELAAECFLALALSAQMDCHGLLAGEGPSSEAFNEASAVSAAHAETFERFATLPHYDEAPAHPTRTGTL